MAAKKKIRLPFDPITGEIMDQEELPWHWVQVTVNGKQEHKKEVKPEYQGLSIIWKENDPFFARLKFQGIHSTYSGSAVATVEDTSIGVQYSIYASEFNDVVDRFTDGGHLEGLWQYKHKGRGWVLVGA